MSTLFTRTTQYLPVGVVSPPVVASSAIPTDDTALEISKLDIPDGTLNSVVFDVEFGTVAVGMGVLLYNANYQDLLVTIGAAADLFRLSPGGLVKIAMPIDPTTGQLTAISFKLAATQVGAGAVHTYAIGA